MALKTFVKVGSITNLSDARYCAGMGVDLLGFGTVTGQDNHITPKQFQEIRGWVTGPQIIAEVYGLEHADAWAPIQEEYRPDMLEVGLQELALFSNNPPLPYILALQTGESVPVGCTPAYVLVTEDNTEAMQQLSSQHPILVATQTVAVVEKWLEQSNVTGFALQGGQEDRPGVRDYNELGDILEMLDAD